MNSGTDITKKYDIFQIFGGTLLLIFVFIPMVYMLLKDLRDLLKTKKYWIYDTISLHCRDGANYYIFAFICSYCSVYLTMLKSIEFNTHYNGNNNFVIMLLNMISFLALLGIGIVETHPHPSNRNEKIKQLFHLGSAFVFFSLNTCTNSFCAYRCSFESNNPLDTLIIIHIGLSVATILFFFLVCFTSAFNFWLLLSDSTITTLETWRTASGLKKCVARFLVVEITNEDKCCIINASIGSVSNSPTQQNSGRDSVSPTQQILGPDSITPVQQNSGSNSDSSVLQNGCNCLKRLRISRLCALNYSFELGLIIFAVSATMLHSAIKNKMLPFLYIKFENEIYEDVCLANKTSNNTI